MNTDHAKPVTPRQVFIPTFWIVWPKEPVAPAVSILDFVHQRTPRVTDDLLALQSFIERKDPR